MFIIKYKNHVYKVAHFQMWKNPASDEPAAASEGRIPRGFQGSVLRRQLSTLALSNCLHEVCFS